MRFWDSSAVTPLLVEEADSARREATLREDASMLVWYGTLAEIESALCRRLRENPGWAGEAAIAREKLRYLADAWTEVEPTRAIRSRALRLLRVHPLRAADAFQLAAAPHCIFGTNDGPPFFDGRLTARVGSPRGGIFHFVNEKQKYRQQLSQAILKNGVPGGNRTHIKGLGNLYSIR